MTDSNPSAGNEPQSLFVKRKKIFPRFVKGLFLNWRIAMVVLILVIFYALPWVMWGSRPAVWLDFPDRKFYLFGVVFWPQDVIYVTALLICLAYSLFMFTAIAGRLFCGYACPQTVYSELLTWVERLVEGDRNARIKLDQSPWTAEKIRKRAIKHFIWIVLSLWSGFTFIGYFTPIRELVAHPLLISGWQIFGLVIWTLLVYLIAGILREQFCKYICPYARFQSVMLDKDSMIVTYDEKRGEPRMAHRKDLATGATAGDCIDCSLCMHVCPVGIDIRKGLQYECIGCGACIDACDSVMTKLKKPVGLVRYATENAMENGYSKKEMLRHVFRPRIIVYLAILIIITAATVASLAMRNPVRVDAMRDRGVMAREVGPGVLENVYKLQILNTEERPHAFTISVEGQLKGLSISRPTGVVELQKEEARLVPVGVRFHSGATATPKGVYPIRFIVKTVDGSKLVSTEKSTFIVPMNY